jgi:hypothetical protein
MQLDIFVYFAQWSGLSLSNIVQLNVHVSGKPSCCKLALYLLKLQGCMGGLRFSAYGGDAIACIRIQVTASTSRSVFESMSPKLFFFPYGQPSGR